MLFKLIATYPTPGADDHYKGFEEVYGENPADKHRPSIRLKRQRSLSFSPSQQHVKNVGLLVECEEWRLLFCKHKLKPDILEKILEDVSYMCGATFG